jgi:Domain of unknown function (DUF4412)
MPFPFYSMKKTSLIIIALISTSAVASADYTIEEQMEHNGGPAQSLTIRLKAGKARCDIGPTMSSIVIGSDVTLLMHSQKMVMKMPVNALSLLKKDSSDAAPAKLEPTGQKQTINGFKTEEYLHDNPKLKSKSHFWIAKDFPDAVEIMKMIQAFQTPMTTQFMQSAGVVSPENYPGLPIRTEIESNSKTIVNVISIKKEPLDDSAFVVPPDYRSVGREEKD